MNTRLENHLLVVVTVVALLLQCRVSARPFTVLHDFTPTIPPRYTNNDGATPWCSLVLSNDTLYGIAHTGGASGNGSIFAAKLDGGEFTTLYSFTATAFFGGFNADGAFPVGGLVLSGNTLYGTARDGGRSGNGTVFGVNMDGTSFRILHTFTESDNSGINLDGAHPAARLVLCGNRLFGAARVGGTFGLGTIFAINTDASGFTNVHNFNWADGGYPVAPLTILGQTIYGAAAGGGNRGYGTLFRLNLNGLDFTNLYNFDGQNGASPEAELVLCGNTLYGTTSTGGYVAGEGTVFGVNTDGTSFTNLHSFTAFGSYDSTNQDGALPFGGLVLFANTLYGTTRNGGISGAGTVFAVNRNGSGFANPYTFTAASGPSYTNIDGAGPSSALVVMSNTVYGTALSGGNSGNGTVFRLDLQPELTLIPRGTNLVFMWPTNFAWFNLQSTTNFATPDTWTPVSARPIAFEGNNVVTNHISIERQFFRLQR